MVYNKSMENISDKLKKYGVRTEYLSSIMDRAHINELLGKLEEHSPETLEHSVDVANRALKLAQYLHMYAGHHMSRDDVSQLYTAALLHDVGKLNIDKKLLHHKGPLNLEEKRTMRTHVTETKNLLTGKFSDDVINLACSHHERLNGHGYGLNPSRPRDARTLKRQERILAVADVLSAMLEDRSYQSALPLDQAIDQLQRMAEENELDKTVVNAATHVYARTQDNDRVA